MPSILPRQPDVLEAVQGAIDRAVSSDADLVIVNAGASAGTKDFTSHAVAALGEVLVHGVKAMPGKPTLLGRVRGKPVVGAPGYPAMRLWPAAAQHFCDEWQSLPRVLPALEKRRLVVGEEGWGSFCPAAQPVRCIYLPERGEDFVRSGTIKVLPIPPAEALITLIQHSFSARLIEAAGLAPQRLERLAEIAGQIPLRRLAYPAGYAHLPAVCKAILADLAA